VASNYALRPKQPSGSGGMQPAQTTRKLDSVQSNNGTSLETVELVPSRKATPVS